MERVKEEALIRRECSFRDDGFTGDGSVFRQKVLFRDEVQRLRVRG